MTEEQLNALEDWIVAIIREEDRASGIEDVVYRVRMREALATLNQNLEAIGGCSDANCMVIGRRKGQHTNGGCNCLQYDKMKAMRVVAQHKIFQRTIAALQEQSK